MTTATGAGTRAIAIAVALGVALGVLTHLLPATVLGPVVDSVAFWALCGFAAGAFAPTPRAGMLAGTITEVVGIVLWYGYDWSRTENFEWALSAPRALIWLVGAGLAGVVFGLAGVWWRTRAATPRLELGAALPVAVHLWAAVYGFVVLDYVPKGAAALVLAAALLLALPRTARDRVRTAVAVVPVTALGLVAGAAFFAVAG